MLPPCSCVTSGTFETAGRLLSDQYHPLLAKAPPTTLLSLKSFQLPPSTSLHAGRLFPVATLPHCSYTPSPPLLRSAGPAPPP